jgi:hypothetical protein
MARVSKKMFKTLQVICGLSAIAAFGIAPTVSSAATIDVTPSSMGSWAFDNRDSAGVVTTPITGSMVTGPATPPLGTGSANLTLPAGTGNQGSELRDTGYYGTALSTISALSYSTYATAWNGQQLPYFMLYISSPTNGVDRLTFEPTYSPSQGAVALNTWQTWNAFTGGWYDDAGNGNPGVGNVVSFSALQAIYSNAIIVNANYDSTGLGGVRFNVGFASAANSFNGYVDNFTIGINGANTTYNFDPAAATPLPAALPLFATGLGALGLLGWRRKKKAAALATA